MHRIIFIVGSARSGSTFLSKAISKLPNTINIYENRYVWNVLSNSLRDDYMHDNKVTESSRRFLHKFVKKQSSNYKYTLIDKTPSNLYRVHALQELFPDAIFIILDRDYENTVKSRKKMWSEKISFQRLLRLAVESARLVYRGNIPASRLHVFIADVICRYLFSKKGFQEGGERIEINGCASQRAKVAAAKDFVKELQSVYSNEKNFVFLNLGNIENTEENLKAFFQANGITSGLSLVLQEIRNSYDRDRIAHK